MYQDIFTVKNQTYSTEYEINNVNNLSGNQITTFVQLYNLIENIFEEIIDNIFRLGLSKMNDTGIKYVNVGGKSINRYINEKYIKKSFDFDIHLVDEKTNKSEMDTFGENLEKKLEQVLDRYSVYRYYIYYILLRHKLISKDEKVHYIANKLFYYGQRENSNGDTTNGIFFHFVFRNNLLKKGQKYSNLIYSKNKNELYYPISDIDFEQSISFDFNFTNEFYFFENYDKIIYLKYIASLFNLINLANTPIRKQAKHLEKLTQFVDINKYNCSCLNAHKNFDNDVNQLKKDLNGTTINVTNDIILEINNEKINFKNNSIMDIISKITDNYKIHREESLMKCDNSLIMDYSSQDKNNIFMENVDKIQMIAFLENTIMDVDEHLSIYYYTSDGFTQINNYLSYNYLGLGDIQKRIKFNVEPEMREVKLSNGVEKIIHLPEVNDFKQLNIIIKDIDGIFDKIHTTIQYQNYIKKILNVFTVYRFQNFVCFNSPNGDQFNPSVLKKGDIMYMPIYVSTTFRTNIYYENYVQENTVLLKISINRNSKNWIFLNQYSESPDEAEILIKRGSYFVVEGIDILPIKMSTRLKDIKVIHLVLYDKLTESISHDKNKLKRIINISNRKIITTVKQDQKIISTYIKAYGGGNKMKDDNIILLNNIHAIIFPIINSKKTNLNLIGKSLENDMTMYNELVNSIDNNSDAFEMITNITPTYYKMDLTNKNIEQINEIVNPITITKMSTQTPIVNIFSQPNNRIPNVAYGGNYYKYLKYRTKYMNIHDVTNDKNTLNI